MDAESNTSPNPPPAGSNEASKLLSVLCALPPQSLLSIFFPHFTAPQPQPLRLPNPKRQAAGRLNRQKRRGLTEAGREKLRQSALKHRPWQHSTGPRTDRGKRHSADNGRYRQRGGRSIRQMKAELRDGVACADELQELLEYLRLRSGS